MASSSRSVLVTGCSTGIGRATAQRLAERGWTVYATARRPETIADLEKQGCRVLRLDVCDEASMADAVETVARECGAVDALVNNAGYGLEGAFEETPMDEVRRQFETNVIGLTRLTQLVLPGMRGRRWGRIVNVSSMGGRLTLPGGAFYHATKHAVEALSDALRFEVAAFGVRVVLIEPGPVLTSFADTAVANVKSVARDGSPYAAFNANLAERIASAYEGPMRAFAVKPEAVARVIERAIASSHPRTRYRITAAARILIATRRLLPDHAFDLFLRTQFARPRP